MSAQALQQRQGGQEAGVKTEDGVQPRSMEHGKSGGDELSEKTLGHTLSEASGDAVADTAPACVPSSPLFPHGQLRACATFDFR